MADMMIKSISQLFTLKNNKATLSLVIETIHAKMCNMLNKKKLVLDYILYRYINYNLVYKIQQYLNCYEYGHISVNGYKSTKCGACSGLYKTLEYF